MEMFVVFFEDGGTCTVEAHYFYTTHDLLCFYSEEDAALSFFKMKDVRSCIHQKKYSKDEIISQMQSS